MQKTAMILTIFGRGVGGVGGSILGVGGCINKCGVRVLHGKAVELEVPA